MEKSAFSTIKYDSIKKILKLISNQEKISRSEIAAETGLSLMTVGKAADALLDSDIIIQSKETRSAAGRKAGLINLNPLYFCIILDLKEKPFRAYIINSELKIIALNSYDFDINYYYDENLLFFLQRTLKYYEKELDMNQCYGVGTVLPVNGEVKNSNVLITDWYDEMNRVTKKDYRINEILYETCINSAAAFYKSRRTPRRILYIYLGDSIYCAFITDDNVTFSTCFEDVILHSGKRFHECVKSMKTDGTIINDIALLMHNIIKILSPDEIVFETPDLITSTRLINDIKKRVEKLGNNLPFTYTPEYPPSIIGIAHLLRLNWFDLIPGQKKK
ncbi:MAG: winged helix-turn-helix transcriptional regulator [Eubacteriales bacterium]